MSEGEYPIPAATEPFEEVISNSRFLTLLAHSPDAEAAHRFIREVRAAHADATHHCWAYVAGPPGDTRDIGMSDDGEPHGTAGRPMLNALLHSGVGEVVAVCVRWYGGTKLGTGGLSRAYAGGVKQALQALPLAQRVPRTTIEVRVGYPHVDALHRLLVEFDAVIVDERYAAEAQCTVQIAVRVMPEFQRRLADASAGSAQVRRTSE